ncbi:MAG: cytochrome c3 family protein [Candidatus Latescibacterota bacterium]|nr:MAG: cytochrome c3 family protein [Candidatus Latescibacterota bacterium]
MRCVPWMQVTLCVTVLVLFCGSSGFSQTTIPSTISGETKECIECHYTETAGIYQEWGTSKHFRANVGCFECHRAEKGDVDAFDHNGYPISIIVSPKDCSKCHATEVNEFDESHHAKAGMILGSLDNFLADIVEGDWEFYGGSALTVSGCKQCHGAVVEVNKDGSLKPTGWPNTGMGRLNPDGSIGACTACHQRHAFSAAQARRPENCGKCHLGPDHPQKEVYEESKHGIAFAAHEDDLNLGSAKWVLGEDYTAAPTCATCHMSAVRTTGGELMPVTHDVGLRISWNNRPPKSIRPEVSDKKLGLEKMAKVGWETRRANMKKVCNVCHTPNYVDNFYEQYDGVINLYNSKFADPGIKIMALLYDKKLITPTEFDEDVEWTWWEIWHHEGRVARHGASMMAPDYTHWHGLYEVAKHWYSKFIPELKEVAENGMHSDDPEIVEGAKALDSEIEALLARPEHSWYTGNLPEKELEKRRKAQEEFKSRYKK